MNTLHDALVSSVATEIALLDSHIATKNAFITTVGAAPGQSVASATNSWFEQLATIQNRLDAAIKRLRDAPR